MATMAGGGSSISKKAARKIGRRSAVSGEQTGSVNAARSAALISTGTQKKALAQGYAAGAKKRAAAGGVLPAKLTGTANALTRGRGKKLGLQKRLAKTTGTTTGEAKGIMKNVRSAVASGNKAKARRVLTRSLAGGPRAGVAKNPRRTAKAEKAAKKITRRIAKRQSRTNTTGRVRRTY